MNCASDSAPNAAPDAAAAARASDADHYWTAAEATWPASQHLLQFFLFQRLAMPVLISNTKIKINILV